MYLLLSPAKNLNEKKTLPFDTNVSLPDLLNDSLDIVKVCKTLDAIDISELMKVSHNIGVLNAERFANWSVPFDERAKPAIYLFDGDAYKGLNAYELNQTEIGYLNEHLGILSGLYGLVRPLDSILPYRLEMGTKLSINHKKDLYEFWGERITMLINERLAKIGSDTLINIASNEYFGAVNPQKMNATIITPKFLDNKNGQYKIISFYAKRARGLMARFCAVNNITDPQDLKGFDMEGYYFVKDKSDETNWVFCRDEPI